MILVTGATGNIGSQVVKMLSERGEKTRVFVRDPKKAAHHGEHIERTVGDLTKPETLAAAMKGVEKLFLLISAEQGVQLTRNAVDAAKRAGVRHIVVLSSGTVTIPKVKIGVWHKEREEIVEAAGIPWTFVRPGAFMTNTLRWADTIKSQNTVYQAHGNGRSTPIHEYDMAAVCVAALTSVGHEGERYPITGPEAISAVEQTQILSRVLGRELRFVDVPEEAALSGMQRSGMPAEMAEAVMELVRMGAGGRVPEVSPWVQRLTGRAPRTYETWARDHAADFR